MERKYFINRQILEKKYNDKFVLPNLLKEAKVGREYNTNGEWTVEQPKGKPDNVRVVFNSIEHFQSVNETYLAWEDLKNMENRMQTPELPKEILNRMQSARISQKPLILFSPWGVRGKGSFGDPEKSVLNRLKEVKDKLQKRNIPSEVLIMPADVYATEINKQTSVEKAAEYFSKVKDEAKDKGFFIKPWSEIRNENIETYRENCARFTEKEIRKILPGGQIQAAINAAERRSGYTDKDEIKQAALFYLRERICEAIIIEGAYKPVKVSLVKKEKDNKVDMSLPRVYVISDEYLFPWLK